MPTPVLRARLRPFRCDQPRFSVYFEPCRPLLARDTFAGHADVLSAYGVQVVLNKAVDDHRQQAGRSRSRRAWRGSTTSAQWRRRWRQARLSPG
jgi:hypothetical protein